MHRLVADRTDHDQLRRALAGTNWDCVHDLSAYHPEDVEIMLEILPGHVGHYIFASSTVTYRSKNGPITEADPDERGETQIEYGLHKLLCEDLLFAAHAETGFPASTVPFSMVLGPHNAMTDREQRMFRRVLDGRPILVPGDGSTLLQVGDVTDQARAMEQMMGKEVTFGRRYNVTGAAGISRNDYVAMIGRVVGREPVVEAVPDSLMEALWTGRESVTIGAPSGALDTRSSTPPDPTSPRAILRTRFMLCLNMVQQLAPNVHWWNQDTVFSTDRLRADVGWAPEQTTESMLARTYEWWQGSENATLEYDWSTEEQIRSLIG